MEHEDLVGLAAGPETAITAWDCTSAEALNAPSFINFRRIVDEFGRKSATAQGLPAPVTDLGRLRSSAQILYIAARRVAGSDRAVILGGLKTGRKRLFVQEGGPFIQIEPICVLDFYVHEDFQRQGVGYQLFEHFLQTEHQNPAALAYDRPSPKLLGFLDKYFGLSTFVPQNNNFVVFRSYWEKAPITLSSARQASKAPCVTSAPAHPANAPVPLLSRHISNLQDQMHQADDLHAAAKDAAHELPFANGTGFHVGQRHVSADENCLAGTGSVLVSEVLSRTAADCSSADAGHRAQAASQVVYMTGAPASICTADCFAESAGPLERLDGLGSALQGCQLTDEASSLQQRAKILQQQNARKCFAVVPPWAVHVPLKRGSVCQHAG